MKASELARRLMAKVAEHGDFDVHLLNGEYNTMTPVKDVVEYPFETWPEPDYEYTITPIWTIV